MGQAERIWLLLVALALAGAWFAETGHAGWPLALTVAGLIALKGRLVIDHYMELVRAHVRIRLALRLFTLAVPAMVLLSHGFGEVLRRLTAM